MPFAHPVTARLWEPIRPVNRGERYEDPLQEVLQRAGVGEVEGGGSQLSATGEVAYAELAVYLADLEGALQLTKDTLEAAGAPEGSEFLFDPDAARAPVPFGRLQSIALYLDGVGLPDQVYADLDFDSVLSEIEAALAQPGRALHDTWMGNEETGLFFFVPSADEALARLEPTLRRIPVCQNARVVLRHGRPDLPRREFRLPRH